MHPKKSPFLEFTKQIWSFLNGYVRVQCYLRSGNGYLTFFEY